MDDFASYCFDIFPRLMKNPFSLSGPAQAVVGDGLSPRPARSSPFEDEDTYNKFIIDEVSYTFLSFPSVTLGYNYIANCIKSKDLNSWRIAVVCEEADESIEVMKQLGKRGVACLLLDQTEHMLKKSIPLWTGNSLNAVLVLHDDILRLLVDYGNVKVNCLINVTLPFEKVLEERIEVLLQAAGNNNQVLVLELPILHKEILDSNEPDKDSIKPQASESNARDSSLEPSQNTNDDNLNSEVSSEYFSDEVDVFRPDTVDKIYTYHDYGIYAWSRYKQESCYNILDVPYIQKSIRDIMLDLDVVYDRARSVQRYAWPHVGKGRSLCVVAHEESGKTWCYLPFLCQRVVLDAIHRKDNPNDFGPSCIILCANRKQGDQIANWCNDLLFKSDVIYKFVLELFDVNKVDEIAASLQHPSGILVTTVELMEKLCQKQSPRDILFNPITTRCVAIDNLDISWRSDRTNCENVIQFLLQHLRFGENHTQLLIVGRLWSNRLMREVLSKCPDMLLIFNDALEAAIFGGIKFELALASDQNFQQIVELLGRKKLQKKRVAIACQTQTEAKELSTVLMKSNIDFCLLDNRFLCRDYKDWGQEKPLNVLIVTDDAVPNVRGLHVDCLVHYNFATSWTRFKARFSLFYKNYQTQKERCSASGTSIIYVRAAHNDELIWFLCDFMLKHDRIPKKSWIEDFSFSRIKAETLQLHKTDTLCRHLTAYGLCTRRKCQYRHILWDFETWPPKHHPTEGIIQFHVLSCPEPSQVAAKLTKRKIIGYHLNNPLTELGFEIQQYYEDPKNRKPYPNPKPGEICVTMVNNQYQRVAVTRNDMARIEVRQLDAGINFSIVNVANLFICADQFIDSVFEAQSVRITGLTPFNMERIWPVHAKELVKNKFFRCTQKDNPMFTAKVNFAFYETIFVENICDQDGNDLISFLQDNNILHYMDNNVKNRIEKVVGMAVLLPKNETEAAIETEDSEVN